MNALIFDMDGVLIDSEHLWRKAMILGFNGLGVHFTEEDCRKTTGMRFIEVAELWLKHFSITHCTPQQLEKTVLDHLISLINAEGVSIAGAPEVFEFAAANGLQTGLATSSPVILMNAVLKKLKMDNSFNAVVSAENMPYGKPHPEVFLECARQLGVQPQNCMVIEDSINGIIAAKAARMTVFAIPDNDLKHLKAFGAADYFCESMFEVKNILQQILKKS